MLTLLLLSSTIVARLKRLELDSVSTCAINTPCTPNPSFLTIWILVLYQVVVQLLTTYEIVLLLGADVALEYAGLLHFLL